MSIKRLLDEQALSEIIEDPASNFESYINGVRISDVAKECLRLRTEIKKLVEENKKNKDIVDDYKVSFRVVLDEKCPKDEIHCGCVPIMRTAIANYRNSMILITTFPDISTSIIKIAENSLKENQCVDTSAAKAVGEYWVNKLNDTEYKLNARISELEALSLEKSIVMHNQEQRIAELEAYADKLAQGLPEGMLPKDVENIRDANRKLLQRISELEAERKWIRKWIPVGERLPKTYTPVLTISEGAKYPRILSRKKMENENWEWAQIQLTGFVGYINKSNVTHWMPMPKPPETE